RGGWIDDVPDIPQRLHSIPGPWYTPYETGTYYIKHGVKIHVDECAQQNYYEHLVWQFWEHHPGAKAKLMAQATWMLWNPRVEREGGPAAGVDPIRHYVEPVWVIVLYVLGLVGLFVVASPVRVLALLFVGYETLAAWRSEERRVGKGGSARLSRGSRGAKRISAHVAEIAGRST